MSDAIVGIQARSTSMAGFARALTVLRAIADVVHAGATMTDPDDAECSGRVSFAGLA